MSFLKKAIRKCLSAVKKLKRALASLPHAYRYGGCTRANIAYINHGGILRGKRVLITGGGSGIGLGIARKCLSEGASVVITGRNAAKLQAAVQIENNAALKSMVWDVSAVAEAEARLEEAEALLGGQIDILVNNAGIVNATGFLNVTEEAWDTVYATNSKGLYFLTQSLCRRWMKNRQDTTRKVINISSQGGFVGATYPYRMGKWDIAGLTQGLGISMAPHGIIVNGIAPGVTATDALPFITERKENLYYAGNPSKRYALPEEMAELAVFLMSDATNFIVGQTIVCDGGYSIK